MRKPFGLTNELRPRHPRCSKPPWPNDNINDCTVSSVDCNKPNAQANQTRNIDACNAFVNSGDHGGMDLPQIKALSEAMHQGMSRVSDTSI